MYSDLKEKEKKNILLIKMGDDEGCTQHNCTKNQSRNHLCLVTCCNGEDDLIPISFAISCEGFVRNLTPLGTQRNVVVMYPQKSVLCMLYHLDKHEQACIFCTCMVSGLYFALSSI